MGRPPLQVKLTAVRLPIGVAERIDFIVGANKRAAFIRKAVLDALEQQEAASRPVKKVPKPPPD